jgi:hypothetical protein
MKGHVSQPAARWSIFSSNYIGFSSPKSGPETTFDISLDRLS